MDSYIPVNRDTGYKSNYKNSLKESLRNAMKKNKTATDDVIRSNLLAKNFKYKNYKNLYFQL